MKTEINMIIEPLEPTNRLHNLLKRLEEENGEDYLELYIPELTPEEIHSNINECYQNLSNKYKNDL